MYYFCICVDKKLKTSSLDNSSPDKIEDYSNIVFEDIGIDDVVEIEVNWNVNTVFETGDISTNGLPNKVFDIFKPNVDSGNPFYFHNCNVHFHFHDK